MSLLPKYISHSEVRDIFSSRLNQIIQESLKKELPEIETELVANIAEKESTLIIKTLTESIEDVINQKIKNLLNQKVGW
ncbi:hypothetical protein [Moorena sp. SIO3I6]|uniref:hypothetical protein n=1 Tax=Moorena sp. SIO3I6 TaxID=2607831 RepID=UPI0013F91605|nr:hypothetical protein [Moorena sp. SIO3I6]NEP23073.1 hypothetical protein [Moorena sp. SIO3I6]